jgi:metal-responsive CopG/Arc/MetJ family transcriptional regulator
MELTASLEPEDLAELDRVCRRQRLSRTDAIHEAVRWYIGWEGDLPPVEDTTTDEL